MKNRIWPIVIMSAGAALFLIAYVYAPMFKGIRYVGAHEPLNGIAVSRDSGALILTAELQKAKRYTGLVQTL